MAEVSLAFIVDLLVGRWGHVQGLFQTTRHCQTRCILHRQRWDGLHVAQVFTHLGLRRHETLAALSKRTSRENERCRLTRIPRAFVPHGGLISSTYYCVVTDAGIEVFLPWRAKYHRPMVVKMFHDEVMDFKSEVGKKLVREAEESP